MYFSRTLPSLAALISLAAAIPSPIELAPRCGTTVFPTFLQQLTESSPNTVNPNTLAANGDFHVSLTETNGQSSNRIYQIVAFQGIPAGSYGCQLSATFPNNAAIITQSGNTLVNVYTLFAGSSSKITYPNNWSWNVFAPFDQAHGVGSLFGTVRFSPGATSQINSESCPVGGGNLAFLFEISTDQGASGNVEFNEYINRLNGAGLTGVYLTYNC